MPDRRQCYLVQLPGLTEYGEALALQRELAQARIRGELSEDVLILLEHPRVITLGRGARNANITAPPELLAERGITVAHVERGGDVTYHGPGQLVGYPIIDLTRLKQDLHWYLRRLEDALIGTLGNFGVAAKRVPGYTGVWVQDRKIASIGVHVTRWVTFHGFALNVNTELADFDLIVPCGIEAVQMTSMAEETGGSFSLAVVGRQVAQTFASVFGLAMAPTDLKAIRPATSLPAP